LYRLKHDPTTLRQTFKSLD